VAAVLTPVQTKQIRINVHERNNTKNTVQTIQNTVHTSTDFTKTSTHYKTILIMKAKKMHHFSTLFWYRTVHVSDRLLSIISSLNTVFTVTGICRTGYVGCLLARLTWNCAVNTVLRLLMMGSNSVRNM